MHAIHNWWCVKVSLGIPIAERHTLQKHEIRSVFFIVTHNAEVSREQSQIFRPSLSEVAPANQNQDDEKGGLSSRGVAVTTKTWARPNLLKRRTEKIENFKINLGDFEVGWNSVTLEYPCNGEPRPRVSLHQLYAPAACSATSASFSIWKDSKLGYGTQNVVCEF